MGSPKARTPSLQTVKMKIPLKTLSKYFLSNFTPNSIMEVFEMFQDTDPNILNDLYNQVGRNKDILVECMLNGGELPEQYIEQFTNRRRPQEDNKSDVEDQNLNNLVDLDGEADPETIARQIQMIEQASKAKEERESIKAARRLQRETEKMAGMTDEQIAKQMQDKEIQRLQAQEQKEQRRAERQNRERQQIEQAYNNYGESGTNPQSAPKQQTGEQLSPEEMAQIQR